jgi:hypothetical protein
MKKYFLLFLIFAPYFAMTQSDQNQTVGGNTAQFMGLRYKMKKGQQVYFLENNEVKSLELWSKLKFSLIDEVADTIFIRFNRITFDPDQLKLKQVDSTWKGRGGVIQKTIKNNKKYFIENEYYQSYVNESNSQGKYFLLKRPKHSYSYKYRAFTTGTLILPIKIRFRVDSFPAQATPDVSVGAFFGYQFGKKDYYSQKENTRSHTWALFAAPGLIPINSSNSTDSLQRNSTNFGISCGGGYLYELNKFQMGFFVGYDFVFGDPSKTWIYQPGRNSNKPWISVAIGFKFNKE